MATIALAPQQKQNIPTEEQKQAGTYITKLPFEKEYWYDYLQSNTFSMVFAIVCTIILCMEIG